MKARLVLLVAGAVLVSIGIAVMILINSVPSVQVIHAILCGILIGVGTTMGIVAAR